MEEKINNTCNGNCSNCGECCTAFLPVTKEEVERIRAYVKEHNIKEVNWYDKPNKNIHLRCCFRDDEKKICRIYPVRPKICQLFKCNQLESEITFNKLNAHKNAFYCHMGSETSESSNVACFQSLIYEDYDYEINCIAALSKYDENIFIKMLSACAVDYIAK